MSFGKYILPILMQFFSSRKSDSGLSSQAVFMNAVTSTVKKEISGLVLKIAFGLVATGVLIYSLVILGQYLHAYILLFDNGPLLSVLFFILLSAACIFAVFKLFYQKPSLKDPFESLTKNGKAQFSFEEIYHNFMSGLNDGLKDNSKNSSVDEKEPSKKAEESIYKYSGTRH